MKWTPLYPAFQFPPARVQFADIGCGFGGLLTSLAPQFPGTVMLGMEIRISVTAYVDARIRALRQIQGLLPDDATAVGGAAGEGKSGEASAEGTNSTHTPTDADKPSTSTSTTAEEAEDRAEARENALASRQKVPGEFQNVGVIRANAMKHLGNFFERGQVSRRRRAKRGGRRGVRRQATAPSEARRKPSEARIRSGATPSVARIKCLPERSEKKARAKRESSVS